LGAVGDVADEVAVVLKNILDVVLDDSSDIAHFVATNFIATPVMAELVASAFIAVEPKALLTVPAVGAITLCKIIMRAAHGEVGAASEIVLGLWDSTVLAEAGEILIIEVV